VTARKFGPQFRFKFVVSHRRITVIISATVIGELSSRFQSFCCNTHSFFHRRAVQVQIFFGLSFFRSFDLKTLHRSSVLRHPPAQHSLTRLPDLCDLAHRSDNSVRFLRPD
jgi:hypothetical protein